MSTCGIAYERTTGRIVLVHFNPPGEGWMDVLKRDAAEGARRVDDIECIRVESSAVEQDAFYRVEPRTRQLVRTESKDDGFAFGSGVRSRRER